MAEPLPRGGTEASPARRGSWPVRLAWFVGLWLAGVIGAVAWIIRFWLVG